MINILSHDIANKIAAGEVVENYASVLKELMENSIDSNAKSIIVNINNFDIRVDDDGDGITLKDLPISVKKFATSKIKTEWDLYSIKTLGFRGEALPSIGAVSKMTIISKTKDSKFAYEISVNGGDISEVEKSSYINGTSLSVKDLFFNTPARLKFLKSERSELKNIYDIFEKEALVNHNIDFKLFKDSKCIYDLKAKSQKERFLDIVPFKEQSLITDFEYMEEELAFKGFLADVSLTRATRDFQFIYINGRFIQNTVLYKALSDIYSPFITKGRFPMFALFLNIDPQNIDVNVHPRKLEVKFKDLPKIFSILKSTANKAVSFNKFNYENLLHDTELISTKSSKSYESFSSVKNTGYEKQHTNISWLDNIKSFNDENIKVFQLFNKFLVTESQNRIQIIDQHAASERVFYEKLMRQFEKNTVEKQQFLIPYSLDLSKIDMIKIEENIEILEKIGIDISVLSNNSIGINSIPFLGVENIDVNNIITDIISNNMKEDYDEKVRLIVATVACHSGIT